MLNATFAQVGLPDDLAGQTVLDVGCGDGTLAREAIRRGADSVLAIDIDDDVLADARKSNDMGDTRIEYRFGDVEVSLPSGRFDHVVCHNLLHKVRNPIAVLDRLIAATGRTLLLEVTGLGGERPQRLLRIDHGLSGALRSDLADMPLALVGRNGTPHRKREQKFFFSPVALHHLMMEQRRHFASWETATAAGGRFLARGTRRRVEHLVVVSGPTGTGKSTLIERLTMRHPAAAFIAEATNFAGGVGFQVANSGSMADLAHDETEVLFHYDLLRPWRRDARVYERDEALHIIDGARRLDVVTLVASPRVVRQRLRDEFDKLADPESRPGRRLRDVLSLYEDPARLTLRIEAWIDFCHHQGAKILFIDTTDGYRPLDEADWQQIVGGD